MYYDDEGYRRDEYGDLDLGHSSDDRKNNSDAVSIWFVIIGFIGYLIYHFRDTVANKFNTGVHFFASIISFIFKFTLWAILIGGIFSVVFLLFKLLKYFSKLKT